MIKIWKAMSVSLRTVLQYKIKLYNCRITHSMNIVIYSLSVLQNIPKHRFSFSPYDLEEKPKFPGCAPHQSCQNLWGEGSTQLSELLEILPSVLICGKGWEWLWRVHSWSWLTMTVFFSHHISHHSLFDIHTHDIVKISLGGSWDDFLFYFDCPLTLMRNEWR